MKNVFAAILFFLSLGLQAQTIEGTIYDVKTRETIPGVAIFLDGTSVVTTSDNEGRFKLIIEKQINTNLIFSHLSYESLVIQPPFNHLESTFFLQERQNTLQGAVVIADRYTRTEKMKVFKEQFLGTGQAGKSCVILNEEDIVLNYNSVTSTLTGHSNNPIIVENQYLAYHITFYLHDFSVQYTENTLNIEKATRVLFKGTSSFFDQNPYNIRYKKRRDETYLSSPQYFWKNLVTNTLDEAKFRLFNRYARMDPSKYFIIINEPSQKTVLINLETNINRSHPYVHERPLYGVVGISNNNSKSNSEIVFLTRGFSVDDFGNPDTIDHLIFFGDMGAQRVGDMLPRDYNPQ